MSGLTLAVRIHQTNQATKAPSIVFVVDQLAAPEEVILWTQGSQ